MAPTLNDGDDILVDRDDCGERLRDGIYVLRVDEALLVKRLAIHPFGTAGHGPVGQSRLSRLARLRARRRALHRPGDLGRAEGGMSDRAASHARLRPADLAAANTACSPRCSQTSRLSRPAARPRLSPSGCWPIASFVAVAGASEASNGRRRSPATSWPNSKRERSEFYIYDLAVLRGRIAGAAWRPR